MFLLREGAKVLTYLVPTLCVGTRDLDALRPAACRAKPKQETTRSVEEGIPTRRGREFFAALLVPASDRLGVASGVRDSNTANRTDQFSSDPLISANMYSYFD